MHMWTWRLPISLLRCRAALDNAALEALLREQRRTNRVLYALVFGGVGFFLGVLLMQILLRSPRLGG